MKRCIVCDKKTKFAPVHDKCADKIKCLCGHLINKNHIINMRKTMKSKVGRVYSTCKFCNCKRISIE